MQHFRASASETSRHVSDRTGPAAHRHANIGRTLLIAAFTLLAAPAVRSQVLWTETFTAPTLDPSRWSVVTVGVPGGGSSVLPQNGECLLQNRGHLVSVQQLDSAVMGSYRVTCRWRWTDTYDRFQLLIRSDGVPDPAHYGETSNGIQIHAGMEGGSSTGLGYRGPRLTLGSVTNTGPGVNYAVGNWYTAVITDLGSTVKARVEGPNGEWLAMEATITSDTTLQKRLVFHNRELIFGNHQCFIDDVVVSTHIAASVSTFGVGCTGSNGIPAIDAVPGSLPIIGQTFSLRLSNLPITGFFVVALPFFGFDTTNTGGVPLPRDLGILGMPGCTQYVDPFQTAFLFTPAGTIDWAIGIPNEPVFAETPVHFQAAVVDQPANPLGLTASNAGTATLGW